MRSQCMCGYVCAHIHTHAYENNRRKATSSLMKTEKLTMVYFSYQKKNERRNCKINQTVALVFYNV